MLTFCIYLPGQTRVKSFPTEEWLWYELTDTPTRMVRSWMRLWWQLCCHGILRCWLKKVKRCCPHQCLVWLRLVKIGRHGCMIYKSFHHAQNKYKYISGKFRPIDSVRLRVKKWYCNTTTINEILLTQPRGDKLYNTYDYAGIIYYLSMTNKRNRSKLTFPSPSNMHVSYFLGLCISIIQSVESKTVVILFFLYSTKSYL